MSQQKQPDASALETYYEKEMVTVFLEEQMS